MKILYSILSLIIAIGLIISCLMTDIILSREAVFGALEMVGKTELYKLFDINKIFLIISLAFLCSFVIIILLYIKNGKKYIWSSLLASAISVLFFTLYFNSFNVIKNFYLVSKEFSDIVKLSFNKIFVFNMSVSLAVILISVFYLIRKLIRRKKDEKEF